MSASLQFTTQWIMFVTSQWTRSPAWTELISSAQVFFKWNNSDSNDYLSLFIDVISVGVIPWNLPAPANVSVDHHHHHHHHHHHGHQCAAVQTVCSVTTRIKTVLNESHCFDTLKRVMVRCQIHSESLCFFQHSDSVRFESDTIKHININW